MVTYLGVSRFPCLRDFVVQICFALRTSFGRIVHLWFVMTIAVRSVFAIRGRADLGIYEKDSVRLVSDNARLLSRRAIPVCEELST